MVDLAYKVLKERFGYWKRRQDLDSVKYDLKREGDSLYLFPKDKDGETFYWVEEVYEVSKGLGLSCYISTINDRWKVYARIY